MSYPGDARDDWDDRWSDRPSQGRYPDDWSHDPYGERVKHSGVGIASFVIAIGTGIFLLIVFVIAGVLATKHGGDLDEKSPAAIFLGLLVMGGLFLALLGAVLGGVGMAQARRNKLFAGLGLALNCLIVIGVIGLVCAGFLMGS